MTGRAVPFGNGRSFNCGASSIFRHCTENERATSGAESLLGDNYWLVKGVAAATAGVEDGRRGGTKAVEARCRPDGGPMRGRRLRRRPRIRPPSVRPIKSEASRRHPDKARDCLGPRPPRSHEVARRGLGTSLICHLALSCGSCSTVHPFCSPCSSCANGYPAVAAWTAVSAQNR